MTTSCRSRGVRAPAWMLPATLAFAPVESVQDEERFSRALGVPVVEVRDTREALAAVAAAVVLAISATATRREQRERVLDAYDVDG